MKSLSWPVTVGQSVLMAGKEYIIVAADFEKRKIRIKGTDVGRSEWECVSNEKFDFPDLFVPSEPETYYMVTKKELNEFGTYQLGLADLTKRPVPVWATHFARKETDEEIESDNSPKMSLVYVEEIEK